MRCILIIILSLIPIIGNASESCGLKNDVWSRETIAASRGSAVLSILDRTLVKGESKVSRAVLYFRWDRENYEDTYLDNAEGSKLLADLLSSSGTENIDSVSVVAYSSPDGSLEYNIKLSRRRADEFRRVFSSIIGHEPDVPIHVRAGGEAWNLLKLRVESDDDLSPSAKKRVIDIIDAPNIGIGTKKWRFSHGYLGRKEDGESVYHYLLRCHYRYLRCLDITIHYHEDDEDEEEDSSTTVSVPSVTDKQHKVSVPAVVEPVPAPEQTTVPEKVVEPVPEFSQNSDLPAVADAVVAPLAEHAAESAIALVTSPLRRPILGISTNLPYDICWVPQYGLTSIPSFSLEYYPRVGNYTFGADVEWPMWKHPDEHRYLQVNNITLWARRYFKPVTDCFNGAYLFGSVNAFRYGIGFNENKGWEGEGAGASVGAGYKFYLSKHFYLDAGIALGAFYSAYDPYVWGNDITGRYYYDYFGNPDDFNRRNKRLVWFGPTRVYFSIGFDIFGKKK